MPTFTETRNQYVTARNTAEDILAVIEVSVDLGQRYHLALSVDRQAGEINYVITHETNKPEALNINKIPPAVVFKLGRVIKAIRDWRQDLLPDFPDLQAA